MHDSQAVESAIEIAERITVRGLVQGVGFRPAVWRSANACGIRGEVYNNGNGVEIYAVGSAAAIDRFVKELKASAARLARIDSIERTAADERAEAETFAISETVATSVRTGVVPDAAVCEECRQEIFDPFSRRYRYPFTNCTNCGPRLSIIEKVPYDRSSTTMRSFEMCPACRSEYEDPGDRRFHAQPIACYDCGPKVTLRRLDGRAFAADTVSMLDQTDAVCTLIQRGEIVAIKGIGGFQLACDATSNEAVMKLRAAKRRERKPFAMMVRDLDAARALCDLSEVEIEALQSAASPIVIAKRRDVADFSIAESVAAGVNTFGVMLPNTPLHHLIMKRMERPIVLTSGNLSDEPQCISEEQANVKFDGVASYLLTNDRPIAQRVDDSVVRVIAGRPRITRRARGFAPSSIPLPNGFEHSPPILAFGGELKNTFCLFKDGNAIVSQHIGDLENYETQRDLLHNLSLYEKLYEHSPKVLVCDLHPEYISAKLARERAAADGVELEEVQHHHAHIASCLFENNVPLDGEPVIGVALDGIGYGEDGTFWGGEFLLADYRSYTRLATFKPVAMIGGEQAIKEPWRNAYAHLKAEMGWAAFAMNYADLELFKFLDLKPKEMMNGMIERGLNSPLASSCGRLFDAAAAAVGLVRDRAAFEGQGAIEFEAAVDENTMANESDELAYPFAIPRLKENDLPYIEPLAMWQALLGDLILKTPVPVIAARFHKGLAKAIVQMVLKLSKYEPGVKPAMRVALSGGVWQNRVLFEEVDRRLETNGFDVLSHSQFPTNDGGISLGQAAIAAARYLNNGDAKAVDEKTRR